jgi:hypothetical protein
MMNTKKEQRKPTRDRLILLSLVAVAALSSAVKDLNSLQHFIHGVSSMTADWTSSSPFTASAAAGSATEVCNQNLVQEPAAAQSSSQEFRWSGALSAGKRIEIKGISGDIAVEPASGANVEVVANKSARRGDASRVSIKVVEHATGVTICAVYPTDDPNRMTSCVPSDSETAHDDGGPVNVRSGEVTVAFKVRVPAGVDFVGRTVNGEITAEALASNVTSKTVNGSIRISTSGYANAKTVNGEINAQLGNPNWSGSLEFKTVNGEINIVLPAATAAKVDAKTFNGEINSEFPLTLTGKFGPRKLTGTIGGPLNEQTMRELVLKTLNGSINLKRAG